MARVMAFDYGNKRLGIAVTDPMKIIASALTTIHPKDVVSYLQKYMLTEEVEAFVVGKPTNLNGEKTDATRPTENFVNLLKKQFPSIPIFRIDERFTSTIAGRTLFQMGLKKKDREKKEHIDQLSAVLILQSYLQSLNG